MSFRDILGGIQDVGGVLIKRGTAMGPLVPSLLLVPAFIFAAWLFRTTAIVGMSPFSVPCSRSRRWLSYLTTIAATQPSQKKIQIDYSLKSIDMEWLGLR